MSFAGVVIMLVAMRHAAVLARNDPAAPAPAATSGMHELFPGVRADLNAHVMEFDSRITPMLVKDDRAPLFFLEVLGCSPNTREHETFVVINARPSHIHAALLAIGLNPGAPGFWTLKDGALIPHQPTGDRLRVRFVYTNKDGKQIEQDPLDWIVNAKGQTRFLDAEKKTAAEHSLAPPGWVFAGSKFVKRKAADGVEREVYDADGSGTILGLTTFGSEVIAWSRIISPDASVEEPEWIADFSKTPPADTKVIVRVSKE